MSAPFKRYANWRAWLRATLRHALHNALGAVLALFGTNGLEASAPAALRPLVEGIGLTFEQAAAVFAVTLATSVLRSVHEATAPAPENGDEWRASSSDASRAGSSRQRDRRTEPPFPP